MNRIEQTFALARERYAECGVNADAALRRLAAIPLSIHAWQGDDVTGFENTGHTLTGGCQVTGNYPGRARNAGELRADLDVALKLIPGRHRVGLQGHQVDRMLPGVDRDGFTLEHFSGWLEWAKEKEIGLDLAPAFYSHPLLDHGFSLSHPDPGIRRFWIGHGRACRRIGAEFGRVLGTPAVCNFWAPDGFKDTPADRFGFRLRLRDALDACFEEPFAPELERDAVESKLFGIGTESCTVGSNDFYLLYAALRRKMPCFDSGHFHPTESVADKLPAVFSLIDEVLLHISRGVHWDSDHVTVLNDELLSIAREAVAYGYQDKVHFALDYFDASINRVAAWVIGARDFQKALLVALLEPPAAREAEACWDFTARLAAQEEARSLPWGAVWEYFCLTNDVPAGLGFLDEIRAYEKQVLEVRK